MDEKEIREMPKSRELDALVEVAVRGSPRHQWETHNALKNTVFCSVCGQTKQKNLVDIPETSFCDVEHLPPYSSGIYEPEHILGAMEGRGWDWTITCKIGTDPQRYACAFERWHDGYYHVTACRAEEMPLAICRAAVLAELKRKHF